MIYAVQRVKEQLSVLSTQLKLLKEDRFEMAQNIITVRTINLLYNLMEIKCMAMNRCLAPLALATVKDHLNSIRNAQSIEDLQVHTSGIINFMKEIEDELNNTTSFISEAPDSILCSIESYLTEPNKRDYNILFYDCCYDICEDKIPKNIPTNFHTYGIFAARSPHYGDSLQTIACGIGKNSRYSNDAFDILILNPRYDRYAESYGKNNTFIPRKELDAIRNSYKYLRAKGLFQIIMPYFRIDDELAKYIAKNFEEVQIHLLGRFNWCEITGIKNNNKEKQIDPAIYHRIMNLYSILDTEETRSFQTIVESHRYTLPGYTLKIDNFRGSRISEDALNDLIAHSTCYAQINQTALDDTEKHNPLLPFNTGQIGLLMASGKLDGIITEDEEHCHFIKGRCYQRQKVTHSKEGTITNNYNQVQINAVTPDGRFIAIR